MFEKLRNWYWRHWEIFDFIESILTSKLLKITLTFISSVFMVFFVTKTYIESKFGITLVGNQPLVDIYFLSITWAFSAGMLTMAFIDRILER